MTSDSRASSSTDFSLQLDLPEEVGGHRLRRHVPVYFKSRAAAPASANDDSSIHLDDLVTPKVRTSLRSTVLLSAARKHGRPPPSPATNVTHGESLQGLVVNLAKPRNPVSRRPQQAVQDDSSRAAKMAEFRRRLMHNLPDNNDWLAEDDDDEFSEACSVAEEANDDESHDDFLHSPDLSPIRRQSVGRSGTRLSSARLESTLQHPSRSVHPTSRLSIEDQQLSDDDDIDGGHLPERVQEIRRLTRRLAPRPRNVEPAAHGGDAVGGQVAKIVEIESPTHDQLKLPRRKRRGRISKFIPKEQTSCDEPSWLSVADIRRLCRKPILDWDSGQFVQRNVSKAEAIKIHDVAYAIQLGVTERLRMLAKQRQTDSPSVEGRIRTRFRAVNNFHPTDIRRVMAEFRLFNADQTFDDDNFTVDTACPMKRMHFFISMGHRIDNVALRSAVLPPDLTVDCEHCENIDAKDGGNVRSKHSIWFPDTPVYDDVSEYSVV